MLNSTQSFVHDHEMDGKETNSRMKRDVAIIGGSAAGFFTAYLLARKGCKVQVYEAREDIQTSPRTLIVTSYMHDLTGSLCERTVINKTVIKCNYFTISKKSTRNAHQIRL